MALVRSYRAASGVADDFNGTVSLVHDLSGGSFDLTPSGGTVRRLTDSVTGLKYLRLANGVSLVGASGSGDFLHQGPVTLVMPCRFPNFAASPPTTGAAIVSTSGAIGQKGYTLSYADSAGGGFQSELSVQISNGAAYQVVAPAHVYNAMPRLLWAVLVVQTSATRGAIIVDGQFAYDNVQVGTLPSGAAALPLTIGGGNVTMDVFGLDIYA